MRISLLLEREPFGKILEKTLAAYWSAQSGLETRVTWQTGRAQRTPGEQHWLANIYLNAIFTPQLEATAFEPIRREFSHSLVWWRRPLQRAYVTAAISKIGARWLAQARLHVTPAITGTDSLLIIPGNHKIRLLDRRNGHATLLLKAGFPKHFWGQELSTRVTALESGLSVPALIEVSAEGSWYTERYIIGTPINRLPDRAQAWQALAQISTQLPAFYDQTRVEASLTAYLDGLHQQLNDLAACNPLFKSDQIQSIQSQVRNLENRLEYGEKRLITCLAHGDFQPANLLSAGSQTWLIDWEYAAQRQVGYDALVYGLQARIPHGLAARLQRFVTHGLSNDLPLDSPWENQASRQQAANLFLLEELQLHLTENDNPQFTKISLGLIVLLEEISRWLNES